jgi:hypothetical protein
MEANMIRKMLAALALGSALTVSVPTSVYAADRDDHRSMERREDRRREHFNRRDRDDRYRYRYVNPYGVYGYYWNTGPLGYYYYPNQTYYYPNPYVYPNGSYGLYGGFWVR